MSKLINLRTNTHTVAYVSRSITALSLLIIKELLKLWTKSKQVQINVLSQARNEVTIQNIQILKIRHFLGLWAICYVKADTYT